MSFTFELYTDNGSVPPRYRRSSRTTLHADGTGTVRRRLGYATGSETEHAFRLDAPEALAEALREAGLWRTDWREREGAGVSRPIGGSTVRLTATLGGETVTVPDPVAREQVDLKRRVVGLIREAVRGAG